MPERNSSDVLCVIHNKHRKLPRVTQVQSMGNDMLPSLLLHGRHLFQKPWKRDLSVHVRPPRGLDAPRLVLKPLVPPPPVSAT